jgi:hypothetical protein
MSAYVQGVEQFEYTRTLRGGKLGENEWREIGRERVAARCARRLRMPAFCSIDQLHGLQSTTKLADAKTYRTGLSPDDGDDVNHACTQSFKVHGIF